MQNKAGTIFLFVIVLAVWGIIAFKIYDYIKGGDVAIQSAGRKNYTVEKREVLLDSFALLPDYRDPFLEDQILVKSKPAVKVISDYKPAKGNMVKMVEWPKINYNGLVFNEDTKTKTGMVKIGGKSKTVIEGDTFKSLSVVSVTRDSIVLKMGKIKKSFLKGPVSK